MAVSILSNTDLKLLAGLPPAKIRKILSVKNVREALMFRRDLQVSMAAYAKSIAPYLTLHGKNRGIDEVQAKIIWICKEIELLTRDAYVVTAWRRVKAKYPNLSLTERVDRKRAIITEWEKILKKFSY